MVGAARDGKEALAMAERFLPDCIMTDIDVYKRQALAPALRGDGDLQPVGPGVAHRVGDALPGNGQQQLLVLPGHRPLQGHRDPQLGRVLRCV